MQAEVRRSSRLGIFSADGALMSDDLWADQGRQRRKRRLRKGKERKDGTEGRHTLWVPEDVSVYNNSITTNYFAAFVEEKTTSKISK